MSRFGPMSTAFHGRFHVLLACSFFQSVKPSWCLEVRATYFAPERSNTSAHWSGLYASQRNIGANWKYSKSGP
jgi:hypothetical protein